MLRSFCLRVFAFTFGAIKVSPGTIIRKIYNFLEYLYVYTITYYNVVCQEKFTYYM